MLDEPFYQLMRQQLLAWRLEHRDRAPRRTQTWSGSCTFYRPTNAAYQQSLTRP